MDIMDGNTKRNFSKDKYYYDCRFANKLMKLGYVCIGTGFDAKLEKYFWVFDRADVQSYYNNQN